MKLCPRNRSVLIFIYRFQQQSAAKAVRVFATYGTEMMVIAQFKSCYQTRKISTYLPSPPIRYGEQNLWLFANGRKPERTWHVCTYSIQRCCCHLYMFPSFQIYGYWPQSFAMLYKISAFPITSYSMSLFFFLLLLSTGRRKTIKHSLYTVPGFVWMLRLAFFPLSPNDTRSRRFSGKREVIRPGHWVRLSPYKPRPSRISLSLLVWMKTRWNKVTCFVSSAFGKEAPHQGNTSSKYVAKFQQTKFRRGIIRRVNNCELIKEQRGWTRKVIRALAGGSLFRT